MDGHDFIQCLECRNLYDQFHISHIGAEGISRAMPFWQSSKLLRIIYYFSRYEKIIYLYFLLFFFEGNGKEFKFLRIEYVRIQKKRFCLGIITEIFFSFFCEYFEPLIKWLWLIWWYCHIWNYLPETEEVKTVFDVMYAVVMVCLFDKQMD